MDILKTLNGPDLVVRFQKYFGVVPRDGFANGNEANGGSQRNVDQEMIVQNGVANGHCYSNGTNGYVMMGNGADCHKRKDAFQYHENATNGSVIANGTHHPVEVERMKEKEKDKFVTDEYQIKNKFFYYLFHFGANLGNEVFYITFYPFWIWNIDGFVGRRVCIFWALFMYLGQATKDILKIPRPASPPVMRMEKLYALEYGMPSTHAMVGAGFPFTILFLTWQRYIYPAEYGFVLATMWTLLVCCSRLYLGMHSVLELLVGVLYVFALMPAYFLAMDSIDTFILQSPLSPFVCLSFGLVLCLVYPAGEAWSPARMDTYIIMAVGSGISVGYYLNFALGWIYPAPGSPPYEIIYPDGHILSLMAFRTTIGVVVLVITRAICKKISYEVACSVFKRDKNDPATKYELPIELPCKFFTYSWVAFNAVVLVPFVFRMIGIERESSFTEA